MSDEEILEQKFFMKPRDVVELFKKYDMEKKDTKNPRRDDKPKAQKRPRSYEGLPLMERAQLVLGKRMTERRGVGYMLDNVPVSCERLLREAKLFLMA
jgi:hypothetical protein